MENNQREGQEESSAKKTNGEQSANPPRYSPRNPLGRILLLIFVFFFGIFAAIGGIIGTFAYLGTRPVKKTLDLFNVPYDKYITEEAAQKSVLDIVAEVGDSNNFKSLGDVSQYTPLVDTLLDKMDEQLTPIGIHIDRATLTATPFSEIGTYFSEEVVQKIVLGEVISLKPDGNALLIAMCYGEEGVDYEIETAEDGTQSFKMLEGHAPLTISELKDSDMSKLLDKITVEAALNITPESDMAMRYLAYGSLGKNYEIVTEGETKTIVMLKDENGEPYKKKTVAALTEANANLLENAKISDLINTEGAGSLLNTVKDWTITDMGNSDKFMDLTLGDLFDDTENMSGIVKTIIDKGWTFRQLSEENVIQTLKLNEIFEIQDGDGIMSAMKDWTINDLSDSYRVERLKISQFITVGDDPLMQKIASWRVGDMNGDKFDTLVFSDVITINENSPKILSALKDTPLGDCSSAIDKLTLSDMLDGDLSSNRILKNLQNCTLANLAETVENLTVADVFGEEIYTYMKIGEKADGSKITYASAVLDYETAHNTKETSNNVITEQFVDLETLNNNTEGKVYAVESCFFVKDAETETETVLGTFENVNGTYVLLDASQKVYQNDAGYYIERKLNLTPVYEWKLVDYTNKTLAPLPNGDSISATFGTSTNGAPENLTGTAYTENGAPMYYLSGDKYYPLYEDAYSYYYYNADGNRVDLDHPLTGYLNGSEPLPLAGGKVTYQGAQYFVFSEKDGDAERNYITLKVPVEKYYYAAGNTNVRYAQDEVEERWFLTVTQNGTTARENECDRFLDGFWYMLFGGEKRDASGNLILDASGNITIIDNSQTPITEIASLITQSKDLLNEMPLWRLYLHGLITANPYAEVGPVKVHNMTISELIQYVTA